jgi:hypothetical protein
MKKIVLTGLILLIANTSYFSVETFSQDQNEKKLAELKAELEQDHQSLLKILEAMDYQKAKHLHEQGKLSIFQERAAVVEMLSEECEKDQHAGVFSRDSDACKKFLEMRKLLISDLYKELNIENNSDSLSATSVLPIVLSQ